MVASKLIMAKKLCNVQIELMGRKFDSVTLDTILPIIFKECLKQNMTFWFNFLEDACVLNLRDVEHENYELNIRQYYQTATIPNSGHVMENYKLQVLLNAFLITPGENPIENTSSATTNKKDETHQEETVDKPIQESNLVPPSAVRVAIELCEKNNEPITRKNIENKLNLGQMSQDKRRQCIAFLRSMEDKL